MLTHVPGRLAMTLAASGLLLGFTASQSGMPPRTATDVTRAELTKVLAQIPADNVSDQQLRVVDIGKYNVAVGVLHRSAKAKQTAIAHAQVTEVYHIIDGSGTFVTGGTMEGATEADPKGNTVKVLVGPSTTGASIANGQSRRVGPGDVIVIPPGVAHWFSAMESDMNYLVVRVDADHVLPTGYVHPALSR
jgi:mannose-6-phosphate isomerase-like protein (cupin superfamily)